MTAYNTLRDGHRVSHRRQQPSGDWAWCASRQDTSRLAGFNDYHELCSWCFLGCAHTLDEHNASIERMRLAS